MGKIFMRRGNLYTLDDGNFTTSDILDDGIYRVVCINPLTGELGLERIGDEFTFNFKLYGLDERLVSHVLDTYNKQEAKHNLGILLNGAKGTGKTVTAKYLCNRLGLPVVVCDHPFDGLAHFITSINHDCVFFFDEFEKNFRLQCGSDEDCAGEDLLSIMDGVYSGDNCHVFILTTNELKVNDNLLSRPSRIRYLKSFGDVIDRRILEEYIDDNLVKKEYKDEILDFVDTLTIATIDIVKSLVDEINLHDCHIDEFKDIFNIKEAKFNYYIRSWWFNMENGKASDGIDKERFVKKAAAPYAEPEDDNDKWRPTFDTLVTNKAINKYKVGEPVVKGSKYFFKEIDLEKKYALIGDKNDRYRYRHVYFDNINTKPSLYDDPYGAYRDGYNDFFD